MSSKSQLADVTDPERHNRDNYYGEDSDGDGARGHEEIEGTDPADYIAFQLLLDVADPICERTLDEKPWNGGRTAELFAWLCDDECIDGRGEQLHHEQREQALSEPELYLPKQTEHNGRIVDYGLYPNRRRYTPDGYINWGETTTTGVPEVGLAKFMQCANNYLWDRERNGELRLTNKDEYRSLAKRLFYDQNHNSHSALSKFVEKVREKESPEQSEH